MSLGSRWSGNTLLLPLLDWREDFLLFLSIWTSPSFLVLSFCHSQSSLCLLLLTPPSSLKCPVIFSTWNHSLQGLTGSFVQRWVIMRDDGPGWRVRWWWWWWRRWGRWGLGLLYNTSFCSPPAATATWGPVALFKVIIIVPKTRNPTTSCFNHNCKVGCIKRNSRIALWSGLCQWNSS